MLHPRLEPVKLAFTALLIFLVTGCSGSGDTPVLPQSPDIQQSGINSGPQYTANQIIGDDGPRALWGLYTIYVTPEFDAYVEPKHTAEIRFDVTSFLLPPNCPNCLTLEILDKDPDIAWMKFRVGLKNPTKLSGYDVRGIIITNEETYLMNPDALTPYAGKLVYENPNGFRAYATEETDNEFPPGDPDNPVYYYQDFQIHLPAPITGPKLLAIDYAVDVSFPGNTQDAWSIGSFTFNSQIFVDSPPMDFTLNVFDHQNDVTDVNMAAPPGWIGAVPVLTQVNDTKWGGTFEFCGDNPAAKYPFYTEVVSGSGTDAKYTYKNVVLDVRNVFCTNEDEKGVPNGAAKFDVTGTYWDDLCPDNPVDYYYIDFADPGFANPGILGGNITLEACSPFTKVGFLYFDPDKVEYREGYSVTLQDAGSINLPVHTPNPLLSGNTDEKLYIRVSAPGPDYPDTPYTLRGDLVYHVSDCGDPISISTLGAPDIPFSSGMVQGALCDAGMMDFYKFDTLGETATGGRLTGTLHFEIEEPNPVPPSAVTAISIRDRDGTLLANFYATSPEDDPIDIVIDSLDLPSPYNYYLAINSPTGSSQARFYKMTWDLAIDDTCTTDLININNPVPPYINAINTPWNSFDTPGSTASMWMCSPDDMSDAYPFEIPDSFPGGGKVLGGTIRIKSDMTSFENVLVSLGLEQTLVKKFTWYSPINLSQLEVTENFNDVWQVPTNIESYPLRYWLRTENTGTDWATAQIELDLQPVDDCADDHDSASDVSGTMTVKGIASGFVSTDGDTADYWILDWEPDGRLFGTIGAAAEEEILMRIYSNGALLASSQGTTPTLDVKPFDFGPGCGGPIIKIDAVGGAPGECVQYAIAGEFLTISQACEGDFDNNDTYAEIQSKGWMWLDALDKNDQVCGVVCYGNSIADKDVIGIAGQPFMEQGTLYGHIGVEPLSSDGVKISLIGADGGMVLTSNSIDSPTGKAEIELSMFGLPSIPPNGYEYYVVVEPYPAGVDGMVPYSCYADLGIDSDPEPWPCPDDGHNDPFNSWDLTIPEGRFGLLCGFGSSCEDVDAGTPDTVDWFRLNYNQAGGEYLNGSITLHCETEGVTVRLMPEDQLACSGDALAEGSIGIGETEVTLNIPVDTIPSIPAIGTNYYVVVHNNAVDEFSSYFLDVNLASN